MKKILGRVALLLIPVLLWFAFFVAFEPNNYFGLKAGASSTQPVARVRAWQQNPGVNLIVGDSRLAHFDMALADEASGCTWQNLAFGGASLKETLDLANYILDSGKPVEQILFETSFYTLNNSYNTDRFSDLERTLRNPLAYCFNLEYNVNALTVFSDTLKGTPDTVESGDWGPADYLDEKTGETYALHRVLAVYPATITPKCKSWALSQYFSGIAELAQRCQARGIRLTVVLPPMAENVRTEVCDVYGITAVMEGKVLPQLQSWSGEYDFSLLDYEWTDRPAFDDDTQFYDGFHLDEKYGLPQWTRQLFSALAAQGGTA